MRALDQIMLVLAPSLRSSFNWLKFGEMKYWGTWLSYTTVSSTDQCATSAWQNWSNCRFRYGTRCFALGPLRLSMCCPSRIGFPSTSSWRLLGLVLPVHAHSCVLSGASNTWATGTLRWRALSSIVTVCCVVHTIFKERKVLCVSYTCRALNIRSKSNHLHWRAVE